MLVYEVYCDLCGEKGAKALVFDTHRVNVGGYPDTESETIDLCHVCAIRLLEDVSATGKTPHECLADRCYELLTNARASGVEPLTA